MSETKYGMRPLLGCDTQYRRNDMDVENGDPKEAEVQYIYKTHQRYRIKTVSRTPTTILAARKSETPPARI